MGSSGSIMLCAVVWLWLSVPPASASSPGFDAELQRGLVALSRKDLGQAHQALEAAAKLKPEEPRVWLALAQTYWREGRTASAGHAAEKAASLGAAQPLVQHALAIFYSEAQQWPVAAQWERRFAANPGADETAMARAAALSLQAGEPGAAVEWAQRARARSDGAGIRHLLGQAYAANGQPASAVAELRAAAEAAPEDEQFTFDYGQTLLQQENFGEAQRVFNAARLRYPQSAQMELAYGVSAYGQRQFDVAIDSFLRVTVLDPSIEQPYVFLGRVLDQAGARLPLIKERIAAWAQAAPQNYQAVFLQAKLNEDEAGLRRSITLRDDYWESHFELGLLLAKQKRWQAAAVELERAGALKPAEAPVHYHLARVYDRLDQPAKAAEQRQLHERLVNDQKTSEAKRAGMAGASPSIGIK